MFTDLLNSSYFALFLIVALGFMLGRIKIKGLSLDVSAVIFIALLFGHFGVIIPKELGNFGLVLFIFTIGIQAGPGFFDSFRSKGKTLIIITLLIICSAALTATGLKYAFDIDTPSVVGLIAGALTSTPGLAVAIDSTHSPLASIAYGIAYPFGVIGVILFVKLLPRIMHIDLDREARRLETERPRTVSRIAHLHLPCHEPHSFRTQPDANQCPCHNRCCNLPPQARRANLHPHRTHRTP